MPLRFSDDPRISVILIFNDMVFYTRSALANEEKQEYPATSQMESKLAPELTFNSL